MADIVRGLVMLSASCTRDRADAAAAARCVCCLAAGSCSASLLAARRCCLLCLPGAASRGVLCALPMPHRCLPFAVPAAGAGIAPRRRPPAMHAYNMTLPGSSECTSARERCASRMAFQSDYYTSSLPYPRASAASGHSVPTLASRRHSSACSFFALSICAASHLLPHATSLTLTSPTSPVSFLLCFVRTSSLLVHVVT